MLAFLARFRSQRNKTPQAKPAEQTQAATQRSAMAYQLLEIIDGELTVCFEYGAHETLNTGASSWLTIYKRDASVCLSLTSLHHIVDEDCDAVAMQGTQLNESFEGRRVRAEANGPLAKLAPDATVTATGVERLRRAAAQHRADVKAALVVTDGGAPPAPATEMDV